MSEAHFVKVSFQPVSEAEMEVLLSVDEKLNDLFSDPSTVEYDGYERGREDFEMFFYGPNADAMASLIIPVLKSLPFADRGIVFKRHGDSERAKEESTKLE
jgi:hypothetical protein